MVTTDQELDAMVELPQRLETTTMWSPVNLALSQSILALNAADYGGSQSSTVANAATVTIALA